ncbi:hypothetical protein [Rhodococcus qingshengii]|uniref:hypothetical protein n=1 Tax=Rhodococcus qingshengii TaxID=334542 RepID=UPI001BE897BD|nr:hypothetical protein [Rhodococcus qingshengii]MBT2273866.1 hypothetical protein [Rhodococcus qingshengii]
MNAEKSVSPEGWSSARLGNQRAFHYYRNGRSLCGKYLLIQQPPPHVTFTIPKDPHSILFTNSDDCQTCQRRMRADAPPNHSEESS